MSTVTESHEKTKHTLTTASGQVYKYQTVTLQVSNVTPGTPIKVQISPKGAGQTIQWSSGSPTQGSSSGMNMNVNSGALPLTGFQFTNDTVGFSTASGGGSAISFTFNASLCATDKLDDFNVTLVSAPNNTQASLALQGQAARNLTLGTPVLMSWDGN
jgi:hypothetical protein